MQVTRTHGFHDHTKGLWPSLLVGEMCIKSTQLEGLKFKNVAKTSECWGEYGVDRALMRHAGNAKWYNHSGKWFDSFL